MTKTEKTSFWERNRKSGGYLLRKRIGDIIFRICRAVLLFGLCFLILQPLLHKLSISMMTEGDLYDKTVINIPRHFSTEPLKTAWKYLHGATPFITSLRIGIVVGLLQVLSCTLVGYGFARYKFPLKNFWFACVILLIVVPAQTLITPLQLLLADWDFPGIKGIGILHLIKGSGLKLTGKEIAYYIVCAGCAGYKGGLYIYMMRQHFRNEPKELEEAAYVDGCNRWTTFWKILLPGAVPMMVSCFLFSFVWWWTDGIYSRVFFAKGNNWMTIANALNGLVENMGHDMERIIGRGYIVPVARSNQILSTGTLLSLVPLIIIYVLAQKSFVESISQSGIKG